ncbi:MAG: hydrogen gas-evolving membrane-bound hydrogenase subunit E [Breznakibacter sp.]
MGDLLSIVIGLIFILGVSIPFFPKESHKYLGLIVSVFPLFVFFLTVSLLLDLQPGTPILVDSGWGFFHGIEFSFRMDGLSLIFGALVSGIGFLVMLYANYYMAKYDRKAHFFSYLTLFMGAMLGIVFSDNLMVLFIFWEITSITSFFLIGFDHHLEKARQAAQQALLITAGGGLSLLMAIILIAQQTGTLRISELLANQTSLANSEYYPLIIALLMIGALTKSAQFPFHFWLPGAMNAPTPVSAYLHSATMVNAGVFLLMRMNPILGDTMVWKSVLVLSGGITMFAGALLSLGQSDLKRILAFTTISALGTMVLLIGIDTTESMKAALLFFIVHGLYKGGLFMIAGIVDKSTGTRDIHKLNNLYRGLPGTSIAAFLALVSMAGLPPMLGFIGKELIYEAKIAVPNLTWLILPLGIATNVILVGLSISLFVDLFMPRKTMQPAPEFKHTGKEYPFHFKAGAIVLAVLSLLLGLFPFVLNTPLTHALFVTRGENVTIDLSLWHGFNTVLLLSFLTVVAGILLFRFRKTVMEKAARLAILLDLYHLPTLFTRTITKYLSFSQRQTLRIQHGYHRYYLITFFIVAMALVGSQLLLTNGDFDIGGQMSPIKVHILLLLMVSSFSVIYAIFTSSRLSAILAMGIVGYGVGMLYLLYGAPDLAITQFLAETVVLILFVMVIYYLPAFAKLSDRKTKVRDILISIGVGAVVTLVVLKARFINLEKPISDFFAQNSFTQGHGRNIVNVIIVDFRAFDTLGEITVLTLAAAGIYSLFRFKIKNDKSE